VTGPVGPPGPEPEDAPVPAPASDRPAATGWPGRPGADSYRVPPSGTPVRPPVTGGVPARPTPLPPPRPDAPVPGASSAGSVAGSLPTTTVVPERSGRPAPPRPAPSRPSPGGRPAARNRRAKLAVKRLDPWSVFVTSLVLSLLLAVATIVAAFLLYGVLSALGVPKSVNNNIGDITKSQDLLTQGKFVGIAALIAGANVLFLTALATLGSMLYNVVATFTGGVELTLSERD